MCLQAFARLEHSLGKKGMATIEVPFPRPVPGIRVLPRHTHPVSVACSTLVYCQLEAPIRAPLTCSPVQAFFDRRKATLSARAAASILWSYANNINTALPSSILDALLQRLALSGGELNSVEVKMALSAMVKLQERVQAWPADWFQARDQLAVVAGEVCRAEKTLNLEPRCHTHITEGGCSEGLASCHVHLEPMVVHHKWDMAHAQIESASNPRIAGHKDWWVQRSTRLSGYWRRDSQPLAALSGGRPPQRCRQPSRGQNPHNHATNHQAFRGQMTPHPFERLMLSP